MTLISIDPEDPGDFRMKFQDPSENLIQIEKGVCQLNQISNCCVSGSVSPALCNAMDCSPPGSSVFGILEARILEWVAIPFSRASS